MQLQIFNKHENLQSILGDEVQDTISTENAYNKLHNEKPQHVKFLDSFANFISTSHTWSAVVAIFILTVIIQFFVI